MSKEQKLKAVVELAIVEARISELERTKTYMSSLTYYRNRLTSLEEKKAKLEKELTGNKDVEKITFTFEVPSDVFGELPKEKRKSVDFLQFLKRDYLVEV
jgi:hypothetical protein